MSETGDAAADPTPGGPPPRHSPDDPSAGQPATVPAPGQARRPRAGLILGVVVGAVALVLAGVVAAVLIVARAVAAPTDAVDAWLSAARAGDGQTIRHLTCSRRAGELNPVDLDEEALRTLGWSFRSINAVGDRAEVTMTLTYNTNGAAGQSDVTYVVVKEGHDWKVCGRSDEGTR
jgi:hypothetical protein